MVRTQHCCDTCAWPGPGDNSEVSTARGQPARSVSVVCREDCGVKCCGISNMDKWEPISALLLLVSKDTCKLETSDTENPY